MAEKGYAVEQPPGPWSQGAAFCPAASFCFSMGVKIPSVGIGHSLDLPTFGYLFVFFILLKGGLGTGRLGVARCEFV